MALNHLNDKEFIEQLTEFILVNMEDENLCVKELAAKSGMSAPSLNQRLRTINNKHLNQFIREVRLQKALEFLQNSKYTAAEVAYQVGFSSPTYFNKCFHEFYGYPPGKAKNAGIEGADFGEHIQQIVQNNEKLPQRKKLKIFTLTVLLFLIAGVATFSLYKLTHKTGLVGLNAGSDKRVTMAVLPFRNMTNDTNWTIWEEGIQSCLINSLSTSGDLVLRSEESINNIIKNEGVSNYASLKPELAKMISKKLGTKVFIYGTINKAGSTIRLNVQIVNTDGNEDILFFHIDGSAEKILQMIDSLSILINNSLIMSELKKVTPPEIHDYSEYKLNSPDAYRNFIYGNLAFYRNDFVTAIDWYLQSIAKDSNFYQPMARIALAYYNENNYEQGKEWCRKYYLKKDLLNMRDRITANSLYALFFGTYYDRIKYLRQLIDLDDQNPMTWFNIGDCYFEMQQYQKAIPEFEKALQLFHKFDTKPYWGAFYYELGISYHKTGQYKKEKKLYRKAETDFPDDPGILDQQAWLELSLGNYDDADSYLKKWISIRKEEGWSEAHIAGYMSYIYSMAGMPDKEEECYRKALSLEPDKANRLNSLAYFLVDKGIKLNEAIALVEKALKLYPENYNTMHIMGYAYYKQGKYTEALDMMQKSWDLRMQKSIYHHKAYLQLEEARKAVNK